MADSTEDSPIIGLGTLDLRHPISAPMLRYATVEDKRQC